MDFIFNDESKLNSHGFVLLNSGGVFDRFRDNPVMLHNHNESELIGKWENLRIDGSRLIASAIFDTGDEFGKRIEKRVTGGFLKGCSPGILPLEADMVNMAGLGLVIVVTKWELMESSVCNVPSNPNSLKLYSKEGALLAGKDIKLSIDSLMNLESLTKGKSMEKITLSATAYVALGLKSTASADELSTAIDTLELKRVEAERKLSEVEQKLQDMESVQLNAKKESATKLVDKAIADKRLNADKREKFIALAMADFETASELLQGSGTTDKQVSLSGMVKSAGGNDRENWTYADWMKKDMVGLTAMRTEDRPRFDKLRG